MDFIPAPFRYIGFTLLVLGVAVMVLAFLRLGKSLTIFPSPKKDATLQTSGLYSRIRHPIYTGVILSALGGAILLLDGSKLLVGIALWVLFYYKSRYEEVRLRRHYGQEYVAYQQKAGRFFPKGKQK
jgi:protein-S-isoprenylcysteine O-methyltransferase Ste14